MVNEHLPDHDLISLASAANGEPDPAHSQHLAQCETCLVRLAELCAQMNPTDDSAASLRAVNLAAARWKQLADGKLADDVELLGEYSRQANLAGEGPGELAEPLVELFLGKRQIKT